MDVDEGRFQVVVGPNLGASAAGRNLGRFADLIGDEATAALQAVGRAEVSQNPNCIWAELVYLPWRFRSANVAVRPHPRPLRLLSRPPLDGHLSASFPSTSWWLESKTIGSTYDGRSGTRM